MNKYDIKPGDYLLIKDNPYLFKIIISDYDSMPAEVIHGNLGIACCVKCDEIIPIPLTTDILEKNGYALYYGCLWTNHKKKIVLRQATNGSLHYDIKEVKYVHELQHILWALGVDDNIEL